MNDGLSAVHARELCPPARSASFHMDNMDNHKIGAKQGAQGMRIYVGGFSSVTNTDRLRTLFSVHGTVTSAQVLTNQHTGQSRGFGFIEMGSVEETQSAIEALNGTELEGYTLRCFAVS